MEELSERVREIFKDKSDDRTSVAISAIRTLLELIEKGSETTMQELDATLKKAVKILKSEKNLSHTSINSGSELFMRFIMNIDDDRRDNFEECKKVMLERGKRFVKKAESSRLKIAKLGSPHINENTVILVHSYSRVVLELLAYAAKAGKQFEVYVTQAAPDNSGDRMVEELLRQSIKPTVILDAAVAYYMERVDMVLVGAEGVLASGGIINKIGTLSVAMVAKAYNKPFFVAAESFKFSNNYPLSQSDLRREFQVESENEGPRVDYTPAEYITLLFTDIGILTPTAVSDELIKLA